ncbi:putative metalloprotease CJM1_0395 family protein [Thiocystis violascens]|uniref:SprA-related family n=1 Tax=Thiocystis violascens (strain ATCC 17096 / DSM 198 / 6111) TaxID=765911 RepID=I3Y5Z3_THIV6|nr:putative metalloprotease CJM1_0395 family protein [Thiocystis violascens]AFL72411.1 SprA-related family [Thiocystis violascens DSM 198]
MEIHSAINSIPFGMPRPAGPTPTVAAERTADLKDDELAASEVSTAKEDSRQRPEAIDSAPELTTDELEELQLLKQRDTEVRAHEQAHVAAGGRYVTSSASYDYQTGPDGQRYAIGGEVGIDTSSVSGDPAATLEKARAVRRAALAPAEPSSQDLRVAASATTMETNALHELHELMQLQREQSVERPGTGEETSNSEEANAGTQVDRSQVGRDQTGQPDGSGARERLEQRIAGFFADPPTAILSQFA